MLDLINMDSSSYAYTEVYTSQLGLFELCILAAGKSFSAAQNSADIQTPGHSILLKRIHLPPESFPEHVRVERAVAWQFYITKRNTDPEELRFSLELLPNDSAMEAAAETGENLIAVGFENGIRQLHLGTEDEDAMAYRASQNDWLPKRLEPLLRSYSIMPTSITPRGLQTAIPALESGEQFYFHYIIAENPWRKSAYHPDEPDISTWITVEQTKGQLEKN